MALRLLKWSGITIAYVITLCLAWLITAVFNELWIHYFGQIYFK